MRPRTAETPTVSWRARLLLRQSLIIDYQWPIMYNKLLFSDRHLVPITIYRLCQIIKGFPISFLTFIYIYMYTIYMYLSYISTYTDILICTYIYLYKHTIAISNPNQLSGTWQRTAWQRVTDHITGIPEQLERMWLITQQEYQLPGSMWQATPQIY
jgi:hypothetical protein